MSSAAKKAFDEVVVDLQKEIERLKECVRGMQAARAAPPPVDMIEVGQLREVNRQLTETLTEIGSELEAKGRGRTAAETARLESIRGVLYFASGGI